MKKFNRVFCIHWVKTLIVLLINEQISLYERIYRFSVCLYRRIQLTAEPLLFSFIIVLLIDSVRFTTILGEDTRLSVCYVHYRLLLLLYLRESLLMNVIILVDGYFSFFHLHNDLGKYGLISWETGGPLRPGDKPAQFSRDTFINKKRNSFLLVKLLFISLCLSGSPSITQ